MVIHNSTDNEYIIKYNQGEKTIKPKCSVEIDTLAYYDIMIQRNNIKSKLFINGYKEFFGRKAIGICTVNGLRCETKNVKNSEAIIISEQLFCKDYDYLFYAPQIESNNELDIYYDYIDRCDFLKCAIIKRLPESVIIYAWAILGSFLMMFSFEMLIAIFGTTGIVFAALRMKSFIELKSFKKAKFNYLSSVFEYAKILKLTKRYIEFSKNR